jgi:hypothetical protein
MITNLFELLYFLIVSVTIGFVSAQVAKALDFAMDYGHILTKLRYSAARRHAKKQNSLEYFDTEFEKRSKILDFSDRLNAIDNLYWKITAKSSALTIWLCKTCLSVRINIVFSIVTSIFYLTANQIHFAAFFVLYLIAFSVNQYFITNE